MSLSFNQDLRKECLRLWCCPAPDRSVLLSHFSDLLKPVLVTLVLIPKHLASAGQSSLARCFMSGAFVRTQPLSPFHLPCHHHCCMLPPNTSSAAQKPLSHIPLSSRPGLSTGPACLGSRTASLSSPVKYICL